MKTKTIFRKPRVIITAIVLAVLVALAAVVIVLAQDKATFAGVSVATDGDINIRFHYTNIQEGVTTARYIVSDKGLVVNDPEERLQLITTEDGKTYFEVPLAAAQMGCDVTVIPLDENGNDACNENGNNVRTYSVRDYAELVFADEDHSQYYSALKAILNYGSYASEYFAAQIQNTVVENEGIFSRETNPIDGMKKLLTSAEAPKPVIADEYAADFTDVELKLCLENTIAIRLYYTYTGAGSVSGKPVEGEANRYYKHVGNIDTTHYTTNYSANLSVKVNGVTAITVPDVTVMSLLKSLVGNEATRDVALAMYNYYYWTATKPTQEGCTHDYRHFEAISLGAEWSKSTCTFCGHQLQTPVHDSINFFSAPGQVAERWEAAKKGTVEVFNDADGEYGRVHLTNAAGSFVFVNDGDIYQKVHENHFGKLLGGTGNYIVVKMRATGVSNINFMADSTYDGYCTCTCNTCKMLEEAGQHGVYQGKIYQYNENGDPVLDDKGEHKFTSYYGHDGQCPDHYGRGRNIVTEDFQIIVIDVAQYQGVDYKANDLTADAATFAMQAVGADVANGAYIDIAYLAVCDSWDEIELVAGEGEAVFYNDWRTSNLDCTIKSDGYCLDGEHADIKLETVTKVEGGTKYSYKVCKAPLCANREVVVPDRDLTGINFYSAPGQQTDSYNAVKNNYSTGVGFLQEEDGVVFNRIHIKISGAFTLTDSIGDGRGATDKVQDTAHGTGNYAVIKLRVGSGYYFDGTKQTMRIGLVDKAHEGATHDSILGNGRWYFADMKDGDWHTYVVDIAAMAPAYYTPGVAGDTQVSYGFKIPNGQGDGSENYYIDIAYFAICDDWSEISKVIGDDENVMYTNWYKTTHDAPIDTATGKCTECHVAYTSANGNVHTYTCLSKLCGKTYTVTTPANANFYSRPGQAVNYWAASSQFSAGGNTDNSASDHQGSKTYMTGLMANDTDGVFNAVGLHQGAQFFLTNGSIAAADHSSDGSAIDLLASGQGMGKFAVIRMRAINADYCSITIRSNSATATTSFGASRTGITDEFVTYVIDISSMAATDATKTLFKLTGNGSIANYGARFDISYAAICDNWDEVEEVVGKGEKVVFTNWKSGDMPILSSGLCIGEHTPATTVTKTTVDGVTTYSYKCAYTPCQHVYASYNTTDVNLFKAAGLWPNKSNWHMKTDGKLQIDANGVPYTRFYELGGPPNPTADSDRYNGAINIFNVGGEYTADKNGYTAVSGTTNRYVVIKIKTTKITDMKIALGSDGAGLGCPGGNAMTWAGLNDKWSVIVIDLEAYKINGFSYASSVKTGPDVQSINVCLIPNVAQPGHTIDIAYAAVCDDWKEIAQLVGDESFVLTDCVGISTDPVYDLSGKCSSDCKGDYTLTSSENGVNTYTCSGFHYNAETGSVACTTTKTLATPTVDANNVNWYTAPNAAFGFSYNSSSKIGNVKYDSENDIIYTHINTGEAFEILNGSADPARDTNTQTIYGAGRYMVLKMRTSSTTGSIGIGLANTKNFASSWMFVGANKRTVFADDWAVYVIDTTIVDRCAAYAPVNASATTTFFGLKLESGISADIAYFAACDNWKEIAEVVGDDDNVILTGWNYNGGCGADNYVEGKPLSEYINYLLVPNATVGTIGMNLWNAGGQTDGAKLIGVYHEEDGGFSRVALWNGGSFELAHRADQPVESKSRSTMDSSLIGGLGKYMVIRVRMGATEGSLGIMARNDGSEGETYTTRSGLEGDATTGYYQQFRTYVIDLNQFSGIYNANGNLSKATFAFKGDGTGGTNSSNAEAGDYIDIQYFAICDNWTEVQEVVGTETEVVYSTSWSNKSADVTYSAEKVAELVAAEKAN